MRKLPNEIFGVREFLYRKFDKKVFEVGDPKNQRFWAISEIGGRNFCQMGRVFLRPQFFRKIEEMKVTFGGAPQKFCSKLGWWRKPSEKSGSDRRRTRGVTGRF